MLTLTGLDEVKEHAGKELGVSDWYEVSQQEIDAFAEVTGDHQWIHVDPERAKDTPFGGTIAHGYYVLSLAPRFSYELYTFKGFAFGSTTVSTRCASPPRCRSATRCACTPRSARWRRSPEGLRSSPS